jgi:hypothetical protein
MKKKSKKKTNKILLAFTILSSIVVVGLAAVYIGGIVYYNSHYLNGTTINGIDVSGFTYEKLEKKIKGYTLAVSERDKESTGIYVEKLKGEQLGIEVISEDALRDILKVQKKALWFQATGESYVKEKIISYDEEKLKTAVKGLEGLNEKKAVHPTDAKISEYTEKDGYTIIPENQGNFLIEENAVEAVKAAVLKLEKKVDLDKKGCYEKPEIDQGNKELNSLLNSLNKYVSVKIVYKFGENKEVLDGRTINKWIKVKGYKASIDSSKVNEYVANLRKTYDTIFRTRTFMTSYGKEVTLDSGDYGWWMNYTKEQEELLAQIKEGKSGERKPEYYQKAAAYGKKDYGDSYVEINLTAQHLFVYKDGEKVLETDICSGNESRKMGTPEGVYGITYKERYGVLVGETYESTVAFWMPFNGDIGLHDAIWKNRFGSDFYKKEGSHGCINLPYNTAKKIYDLVEKGEAVICYRLKGTESDSVTEQDEKEIAQAAIDAIEAIGKVDKESGDAIKAAEYMYNKVGAEARKYVDNYSKLEQAKKEFKQFEEKKK